MYTKDRPLAHPPPRSPGIRVVLGLLPPFVEPELDGVRRLQVELLDGHARNRTAAPC